MMAGRSVMDTALCGCVGLSSDAPDVTLWKPALEKRQREGGGMALTLAKITERKSDVSMKIYFFCAV